MRRRTSWNRRKLNDKIQKYIDEYETNKIELKCIGYNIPTIEIKHRHFPGMVYFTKTKFHGRITFNDVTFQCVDFTDCHFTEINFFLVTFFDVTRFVNCESSSILYFRKCWFHADVSFKWGSSNKLIFLDVEFGEQSNVDFKTEIKQGLFRNVRFLGESSFRFTEFQDIIIFDTLTEFNKSDFSNSKFKGEVNFLNIKFNGESKFHYSVFKDQENVIFDVDDLSNVSFLGMDVTRVKFGERVIWGRNESDRFMVNDERRLEKSLKYTKSLKKLIGSVNMTVNRAWNKIKLRNEDSLFDVSYNKEDSKIVVNSDEYSGEFDIIRKGRKIFIYPTDEMRLGGIKAVYRNLRESLFLERWS